MTLGGRAVAGREALIYDKISDKVPSRRFKTLTNPRPRYWRPLLPVSPWRGGGPTRPYLSVHPTRLLKEVITAPWESSWLGNADRRKLTSMGLLVTAACPRHSLLANQRRVFLLYRIFTSQCDYKPLLNLSLDSAERVARRTQTYIPAKKLP